MGRKLGERWWIAAVIWLAFGLGCAPGAVIRIAPPAPLTAAWGVAVYPVTFRFPVSAYESFARGREIADEISHETNCLVYGPGEFRLIDPDDEDPRRGSTIGSVVRYSSEHQPSGFYVLRTVVNRTVARETSTKVVDSSGIVRGVRAADLAEDVSVRVELLSLATQKVVAQLEGKAHVNLLRDREDGDPLPDITRLTRELIAALIPSAGLPSNHKPMEVGLQTIPVLAPALVFAPPGGQSMQAELAHLDALDREVRMVSLVRRIDPAAPRARRRLYQWNGAGLVVIEATGLAAQAGLRPDDVILTADDEAVLGEYVLERHLAAGVVHLRVRRGTSELELTLLPSPTG